MRPPPWLFAVAILVGLTATVAILGALRQLGAGHASSAPLPPAPETPVVTFDALTPPPPVTSSPRPAAPVNALSAPPAELPEADASSGSALAAFNAPALPSTFGGGWPGASGDPTLPMRSGPVGASPAAPAPAAPAPAAPEAPGGPLDAAAVDEPPRPLAMAPPTYPESARARGVEGWVDLALTIDAAGAVSSVRVVATSPPGHFEAAARRAARAWRFVPARHRGKAVPVRATKRLEFKL